MQTGFPPITDKNSCHHKALLNKIEHLRDVLISTEPTQPGQWKVTIAAADQRGLLSIISGLLAASGCNILEGDIFTHISESPPEMAIQLPRVKAGKRIGPKTPPTPPLRKILDVFEVSLGENSDEKVFWKAFTKELTSLVIKMASGELDQARQLIIDRVCAVVGKKQGPVKTLFPVTIRFDNSASETMTLLRIISDDTPGFLFAFSNALAMLEINIKHAEIRTFGKVANDTFWIQDISGKKILNKEKLQQLRAACALIKQFTFLLPHSADPGQALRQFGDMVGKVLSKPDWANDLGNIRSKQVMDNISALMSVSQFLWEDFLRMQHENLFPVVSDPAKLEQSLTRENLVRELLKELKTAEGDERKLAILNRYKDRQMFRIDLRHITHRISDIQFSEELSDLTDVVVQQAMALCFTQLAQRYGRPMCEKGHPCRWSVLTAGKAGGREMGFASDIELLFVYEGQGQTNKENSLDNALFFEKLVRLLLSSLKARQEGIFQIDLRLRPYGNKGTLACSLRAFEDYYTPDGPAQQFERMALVKLRPVTGDRAFIAKIIKARDAFVYSDQPLDYDNIRHLRQRQVQEIVKEKSTNAKLSPGALVDTEYFIQAKQIVQGAKDPSVRETNAMDALQKLEEAGEVNALLAQDIRRAYRFFRRIIDALRAVRGNAKDLTVPEPGSQPLKYLARRLGYAEESALQQELEWCMTLGLSLWKMDPDRYGGDNERYP